MTRSGSQVAHQRPDLHDSEAFGQVVPFRRPQRVSPGPVIGAGEPGIEPPDDFAQFEQDQDEVVDYRQRMMMNVIAVVVLTFLVSTGVWLADTIAVMEKDQDCMMAGRVNCEPLELPAPSLATVQ